MLFFTFYYFLEENILFNYNLHVIFFLVPNCPFYYVGAKLSWCQIVRCQIVRFYYVGAKLSWCQIVRCQIVLVPNCPGAKLSGAKLSGAKLSYHPLRAFAQLLPPWVQLYFASESKTILMPEPRSENQRCLQEVLRVSTLLSR